MKRLRARGLPGDSATAGALVIMCALLLAGCTRTSMPLTPGALPVTPASAATQTAEELPSPTAWVATGHAVVWIAPGDSLIVREAAGIGASEIARLSPTQGSLSLTGNRTTLGSSAWVEILTTAGVPGWVPAWNVTEQVPRQSFCTDGRIPQLIDEFVASLRAESGESLVRVVSPKRSLVVRIDPWNDEVRVAAQDLAFVFSEPESYFWGRRYASETIVEGSFAEVVVPSLLDVFEDEPIFNCNEVVSGEGAGEDEWPAEYANLNFVSAHRPPPGGGNRFNWRTWLFGIEYVDGEPYIGLIVQVRPQV